MSVKKQQHCIHYFWPDSNLEKMREDKQEAQAGQNHGHKRDLLPAPGEPRKQTHMGQRLWSQPIIPKTEPLVVHSSYFCAESGKFLFFCLFYILEQG